MVVLGPAASCRGCLSVVRECPGGGGGGGGGGRRLVVHVVTLVTEVLQTISVFNLTSIHMHIRNAAFIRAESDELFQ